MTVTLTSRQIHAPPPLVYDITGLTERELLAIVALLGRAHQTDSQFPLYDQLVTILEALGHRAQEMARAAHPGICENDEGITARWSST